MKANGQLSSMLLGVVVGVSACLASLFAFHAMRKENDPNVAFIASTGLENQVAVLEAIRAGKLDVANLLLETGANVNLLLLDSYRSEPVSSPRVKNEMEIALCKIANYRKQNPFKEISHRSEETISEVLNSIKCD